MRRRAFVLVVLFAMVGAAGCGRPADPRGQFATGDYAGAFKSFSQLADSGDSTAINYLGIHYYLGLGVERDLAQAARLFERAALARNADAQFNLGLLCLRGWGVAKDNVHAYGWLSQAAQDGNKRARVYLAQVENSITPNQIMQARGWVTEQMQKAAPPR